jgi:hypothetical protein
VFSRLPKWHVHNHGARFCHPPWRVQRAVPPVKALAATLACRSPAKFLA